MATADQTPDGGGGVGCGRTRRAGRSLPTAASRAASTSASAASSSAASASASVGGRMSTRSRSPVPGVASSPASAVASSSAAGGATPSDPPGGGSVASVGTRSSGRGGGRGGKSGGGAKSSALVDSSGDSDGAFPPPPSASASASLDRLASDVRPPKRKRGRPRSSSKGGGPTASSKNPDVAKLSRSLGKKDESSDGVPKKKRSKVDPEQKAKVQPKRKGKGKEPHPPPPDEGNGKGKKGGGDKGKREVRSGEGESKDNCRPLVLLGPQPRGLHECDYCGVDLTRRPRARCADCPDFDLCLECLATEDHERMVKYKREEERRRRGERGVSSEDLRKDDGGGGGGSKRGRGGRSAGRGGRGGGGAEDPDATGSYVNGVWVPYFRHDRSHGYVIADSTRYSMFPSFRGVRGERPMEAISLENDENKEKGIAGLPKMKEDFVIKNEAGAADLAKEDSEKDVVASTDREGPVKDKGEGNDESIHTATEDKVGRREGEEGEERKRTSNEALVLDASAEKEVEGGADARLEAAKALTANDAGDACLNATEEDPKENRVTEEGIKPDRHGDEETWVEAELTEGTKSSKNEEQTFGKVSKASAVGEGANEEEAEEKADTKVTATHADEKGEPKSKPRYRVVDSPKDAWTAEEDLRLLDAILSCGLGNWPDIAEHVNGGAPGDTAGGNGGGGGASSGAESGGNGGVVGGGKTDKRCMERYLDDFMGRYGRILPPYTLVPLADGEEDEDEKEKEREREESQPASSATGTDTSDGETSVPGVAARKRPRRSAAATTGVPEEEDHPLAPGFKKIKFQAVPTEELPEYDGTWPHPYVPKTGTKEGDVVSRDRWYRSEQSYVRQTAGAASKLDAERIKQEWMEKRAMGLAGYEANVLPPRLDEQRDLPGAELAGKMPRRGDMDVEWDNDAEKIISEMEFSVDDTKADRELKLDVIRIFNRRLDEREKRKRFVIDHKLLNYRENQEKMWKIPPDERHLVQRLRLFARFHKQEEHEAFVKKVLEAKRLRKEIARLQTYQRLGITSLADAERYEVDKRRREVHKNAWMKKEEEKKQAAEELARAAKENSATAGVAPPPTVASTFYGNSNEAAGDVAVESLQVWRQFKRSGEESRPEKKGTNAGDGDSTKFTIKDKPGYALLSKKEIGLCKRLRLIPRNYLDAKRALIAESLQRGMWSLSSGAGGKNSSKSLFKVDIKQQEGIIHFVLEAGWIQTSNTIPK